MQPLRPNLLPAQPTAGGQLFFGAALAALLALTATPLQAQAVYRIVGADGKVTFSDKPPTTAAKATGLETSSPANTGNPALPFELRQAVTKYPVTLYTAKDCVPCDNGRKLLQTRGVPFSEKTITTADDSEALQRLSGGNALPFMTLGGQQMKGFSPTEWTQYLSAAGYPESSQLPATWRNPGATPLVAIQTAATPAAPANSAPPASPTPPRPTPARVNPANPAGIQF